MVALDAGQSEIASMLYSRMNIKCSVSLSPQDDAGGGCREQGWGWAGTMFMKSRRGMVLSQGLSSHLLAEPPRCPMRP